MPNGAAGVSRAGFGKPGYCKICASTALREVNEALAKDPPWTARQINALTETKYGFTCDRATIYKHRDHSKHPADQVVTAVEKARADGNILPRKSTPDEFLEAVQGLAMQRALEHPEEVTIDHGLKAASVLAQSKNKGGNTLIVLARVMTGHDSGVVIEGEAIPVD